MITRRDDRHSLGGLDVRLAEIVAYEDLGPEAIRLMRVEKLPLFVVNDIFGNDLYQAGLKQYARP